jgi:O-antigen/teichoic acid export membrane protein
LLGLQRQSLLNGIIIVAATMRGGGAVLVLWLISPTIQAFLVWRVITDSFQTIVSALCLWASLPVDSRRPRFRKSILAELWRFSAGIGATGVFFIMLTEGDKILLSKILPLETFGYYSFASVAASALLGLAYPITTALFPRFSQLVSQGKEEALKQLYHGSAQLMSVAVLPVTVVLVLFSREALLAWTGSIATVQNTWMLLSLLATGTGICGILRLPHVLQMAHGWTSLGAATNGVSVLTGLPLIVLSAGAFGAPGGALVWPLINVGQLIVSVHLMHRRILAGEERNWYWKDVGMPFLATLAVVGLVRLWAPATLSRPDSLIGVSTAWFLATIAAVAAAPDVRSWIAGKVRGHCPTAGDVMKRR